jgi:hypothetical protein
MYPISKKTIFYFLSLLLLFTQQTQSMDYLRRMQSKETLKAMAYVVCGTVIGAFGYRVLSGRTTEEAKRPPVSRPGPGQVDRNNPTFGDRVKEEMNGLLARNGMQIDKARQIQDDTRLGMIIYGLMTALKSLESHTEEYHVDTEGGAVSGISKERQIDMDPSLDKTVRTFTVESGIYTAEDANEATNYNPLEMIKRWADAAKEYEEAKLKWKHELKQREHKVDQLKSHLNHHYSRTQPLKSNVDCSECGWKRTPYKAEDL